MSRINQFVPSKSKLEAVGRISNLTNSGPEDLGPGSKERKRVLINLAHGLELKLDVEKLTKQQLGERVLNALGGLWTSDCESTGQTVTLIGLNRILEFAEKRLGSSNVLVSSASLEEEATSILTIAQSAIPAKWIGKDCVSEMKDGGSTKWKQTEWQGFYFEYRAIGQLVNKLGGGPLKIGVTEFDYHFHHVWDLKVHSNFGINGPNSPNNACQLNDQFAMHQAVSRGGLGLVVLSGNPTYSVEFSRWHKQFRGSPGEPIKQLKETFSPTHLEAFFIQDGSSLEHALKMGILSEFAQGKQPNGAPRNPKFSLNISKARGSSLQLADIILK
jgi:hypothetical protein